MKIEIKEKITELENLISKADSIVIGAGAGLSTSAGFTYSGERFSSNFSDFEEKYGFKDMYSGGFFNFKTPEETWAYWSRFVKINRYDPIPSSVYDDLLSIVKDKDYFVITTNVDHCFQRSGFSKERLFYTQGDYGLFQCAEGTTKECKSTTFDNEVQIKEMYEKQKDMKIPSELIPVCPICKKSIRMNLREDDSFVQDEGWYKASKRYEDFLNTRKAFDGGNILFLELGVGSNTPGIIKYPFWNMTYKNSFAHYVCINFGEAVVPAEINSRSLCINEDIGAVLKELKNQYLKTAMK